MFYVNSLLLVYSLTITISIWLDNISNFKNLIFLGVPTTMNSATMPSSTKVDNNNCNHHHPPQHNPHVHSHDLNSVYQSPQPLTNDSQLSRRKLEETNPTQSGQNQNGGKKTENKNKKNDTGGIKKKKTR